MGKDFLQRSRSAVDRRNRWLLDRESAARCLSLWALPINSDGTRLMANRSDITAHLVRQLFDYNPTTGVFVYREREEAMFKCGGHSAAHNCAAWNALRAGKVAGTQNTNDGYRYICIMGLKCAEHRLAWLYTQGEWPAHEIDHINGVRGDNRLSNLRSATQAENRWNTKKKTVNTTGFKGVSIYAPTNRYRASIRHSGKNIHLGYFSSAIEAHKAYAAAASSLHGAFANFG